MRIAQLPVPKAARYNSNLFKRELQTPPFFLHEQPKSSQRCSPTKEQVQYSAPATVAANMESSEYQTEPFIKLRLPVFNPAQADIWVDKVDDSFLIHRIKDLRRQMLEICIALTPELRSLTAHMTSQPMNNSYIRWWTAYDVTTHIVKFRKLEH